MKTAIKNPIKLFRLIFPILLAVTFCITGCDTSKTLWAKFWFDGGTTTKPALDPLAGWKVDFHEQPSQAIEKDYHDYIQKLPPTQQGYIGNVSFLEDKTGQHAITIEVFEGNKNASWQHVIIYDKQDKRIKVIRYGYRKYES